MCLDLPFMLCKRPPKGGTYPETVLCPIIGLKGTTDSHLPFFFSVLLTRNCRRVLRSISVFLPCLRGVLVCSSFPSMVCLASKCFCSSKYNFFYPSVCVLWVSERTRHQSSLHMKEDEQFQNVTSDIT